MLETFDASNFLESSGSGIERAYFFTVLIEADTKKENEENLSIYHFKTEQRFEVFGWFKNQARRL